MNFQIRFKFFEYYYLIQHKYLISINYIFFLFYLLSRLFSYTYPNVEIIHIIQDYAKPYRLYLKC